jgi:hypothetical protein
MPRNNPLGNAEEELPLFETCGLVIIVAIQRWKK